MKSQLSSQRVVVVPVVAEAAARQLSAAARAVVEKQASGVGGARP
jgi:hypothetical protein